MKTIEEWSNAFDTLVDSYRRFKDFDKKLELDSIEFDEYQKSIYLTKALELIVKELYSSTISSFEDTEKTRRELDSLIKLIEYTSTITSVVLIDKFIHSVYLLPNDCLYIVYELVTDNENSLCGSRYLEVIPTTHDEYSRTIKNPFRSPSGKKVLRLDKGLNQIEIVSKKPINSYLIRYLAYPEPIILCDLSHDLIAIDGISTPNTCKLNESLHQEILDRAVKLALSTRINNTNKE